ncbi:MAG: cobaltochelatase subunit CobN, partial [Rhodospirillales bacterium]|nr:cobaltochelatase subunit CobN [Rhodospirillales bacterium]
MHLLAAKPGGIADGSEAVDLGQTPGDIVFLSAADSELSALAAARARVADGATGFPSLRLANLMQLAHNMSVDLYVETVIARAKLVVVRLLGGAGYWPYGIEEVARICEEGGIPLAVLPGDDAPDDELTRLSSCPREACHRLWQYCVHGGPANADNLLRYATTLTGFDAEWREPSPLLPAGLYWPGKSDPDLDAVRGEWVEGAPVAAFVFYRALLQADNLAPVNALITALQDEGVNPLPLFVASLKDPVSAGVVAAAFDASMLDVILNAVGFALSSPGAARAATPYDAADCPVLQVVFSGGDAESWREGTHGLSARDISMNVALPEVDGRILSRAVSFKAESRFDEATQCGIVEYEPVPDRINFVARLAANWANLRRTSVDERRIGIVLANYPNRDGRIGNGVGLDTPAGTVEVLRAMEAAGYGITNRPADGAALIDRLLAGPTNDHTKDRCGGAVETLSIEDYRAFFADLPEALRRKVINRWGAPESDPSMQCNGHFAISVVRLGNIAVCIQPARGYNIDPTRSYHDPDLVPPHGYLAFYAWLREKFGAQAVVHMGKHGNMEWLPGKALALSSECFPEAAFGPTPHLYPFIVNDPGEGTQAKRRAQAVIIDHLTPPLTRAETYGPLAELEQLVDEYYEAAGVDPRRLRVLRQQILELTERIGLDRDCGIERDDDEDAALS